MCIVKDINKNDALQDNDGDVMNNSKKLKIKDISLDRKLSFVQYIKSIC